MPQPLVLVALPCAGASATMYLRWRRLLPGWVELLPLELPGRGARMDEAPATRFGALAAQLAAELAPRLAASSHARAGRYILFGHSMGALLAHGLLQRLPSLGLPAPLALLASACAAPSMRNDARFANLETDAQLAVDLQRQGGTPDAVFAHPELLRMTIDLLRADYDVCRSVDGAHYLPGIPVHVFAGRDDEITEAELAAWRGHGDFSIEWFDGGHFYLRQHEALFLARLERRLLALAGAHDATPALA